MARERSYTGLAVLGVLALAGHVVLGITIGEGYAIPTTIVAALAAGVVLRGPLGQALARRIHAEAAPSELPAETVLGELEELRTRVLELEERVDFSERLLAQGRSDERAGTVGGDEAAGRP